MASGTVDVYVKIPTGRTAVYYVKPNDTIETLCQNVAGEEKVKNGQVRLKYQGKILNRNHSMTYLGVRPETILKAEILVPRPVTLLVGLPNDLGETELTLTSLDTISDVKDRIADVIKEDSSRIVVQYDGRPVKGHTLLDAGLVDGSPIQVLLTDKTEHEAKDKKGAKSVASTPKVEEMDDNKKQAIMGSFQADGRQVEVVFSYDTTGSMYSCLDEVRRKLGECCTRLIQDIPNIRIGLVAHGDYCDQNVYVIRTVDLTSDVQTLIDFVNNVPRTGGGDTPECYEWVLRKAQGLDWAEDSAKALVVIGDAEPHPPGYTDASVFWRDELDLLTGMGVKVYGVQALNQTAAAPFYKELAAASGGHYLTLKHFDVITDMFLAVCYREAEGDDLEAFMQEVEDAGRMDDERRHMFQRLNNPSHPDPAPSPASNPSSGAQPKKQQSDRYVKKEWWDPSLGNSSPLYHYDQQTDVWSNYSEYNRGNEKPAESSPTVSMTSHRSSPARASSKRSRGHKKGCSVM